MEPWNDKEFMDWAFGKQKISLSLDGYHKILDKLYETYQHIKDGSIRQRYLFDMIAKKFDIKDEKSDEN